LVVGRVAGVGVAAVEVVAAAGYCDAALDGQRIVRGVGRVVIMAICGVFIIVAIPLDSISRGICVDRAVFPEGERGGEEGEEGECGVF
jgi:hypothetical protein